MESIEMRLPNFWQTHFIAVNEFPKIWQTIFGAVNELS